jgi:hypothetical protein
MPTSAFISVDLPTLGRPAKQAKPDLNPAADGGAGEAGDGDVSTGRFSPSQAFSC